MASTGFTLAGTGANNADAGDIAWTNPGNVTASDDSRAISTMEHLQTTQYCHATNFGFNLPAGAIPVGVEVRVERREVETGGATFGVADHTVQLIKGGTRSGDNKADTGTEWPTTEASVDYGGAADLWGNTLTESDIEASTFGVAVRADGGAGTDDDGNAEIDAISINVHYTESGGGGRIMSSLAGAGGLAGHGGIAGPGGGLAGSPPVVGLLESSGPAAVARLVVPVVVAPVDGRSDRARPHVLEEGLEAGPPLADRDASPAPVSVVLRVPVAASLAHLDPRGELAGDAALSRHAVLHRAGFRAAAVRASPVAERRPVNILLLPANAPAPPLSRRGIRYGGPVSEGLPGDIYKVRQNNSPIKVGTAA